MQNSAIHPLQWPLQYNERGLLSDLPLLGSNAALRRSFRHTAAARDFSALLLWGDDVTALRIYITISAVAIDEFDWGHVFFIPDDLCRIVFWSARWDQADMDAIVTLSRLFQLPDHLIESWVQQWECKTLGSLVHDIKTHGHVGS